MLSKRFYSLTLGFTEILFEIVSLKVHVGGFEEINDFPLIKLIYNCTSWSEDKLEKDYICSIRGEVTFSTVGNYL